MIISTFIIWTWLLGISLVVPTSLPAGGSQESTIQHRENNIGSPLIALKDCNLLSSASLDSSIVSRIESGMPVNILKVWNSIIIRFNALFSQSIFVFDFLDLLLYFC